MNDAVVVVVESQGNLLEGSVSGIHLICRIVKIPSFKYLSAPQ